MRIALAFCVVVGCGLCGNALAASGRRRVETLALLAQGVRTLRVRMIRMLEPVAPALSGAECPILERVGRAMRPGASAGETWAQVRAREWRRGGAIDAMTAEDVQTLDALFAQLGESGREQQEVLLSGVLNRLDASLATAEHAARECERLYLTLSLLTGLMIALVIV